MLVIDYLKNHSLAELKQEHAIDISFSNDKKTASFNYNQIESKESDVLAQQCRGLILANRNNEEIGERFIDPIIVACPMYRFFNYMQGAAAEINWQDKNLKVFEKLDGTLTIIYYHNNNWHMATRSVPEANILMDNGIYTFRTLLNKTLNDTYHISFEEFTENLNKNYTYCFELTTPLNKVVVDYNDFRLTLLSIRDNISLQEISDLESHVNYGIKAVQSYSLFSLESILNWVSTCNFKEHEGVVVCDSNFNRIKIKNQEYVLASHMKNSLSTSPRNCLEAILFGKDDDLMQLLHEDIINNLLKIKEKYNNFVVKYDLEYKDILSVFDKIPSRKEFALEVQKRCKNSKLWQAPFFSMFNKNIDMKAFIASCKDEQGFSSSLLQNILNYLED